MFAVTMDGVDMPEGDSIQDHVLYVKSAGDRVIVTSEPKMTTPPHETAFNLKDPNECRLFLRAVEKNPDLMARIATDNGYPVVARAIENLGKSFGESVPALIKTDLATINAVGNVYSSYKNVNKAVLAARESAAGKGVTVVGEAVRNITGQRRDNVIAEALK